MSRKHSLSTPAIDTAILSDRRGFFVKAIGSLLAVIGAGLGIPAARYLFLPPRQRAQSRWMDLGEIADLAPDAPQEITFRRTRAAGWDVSTEKATAWVVKRPGGEITAFAPWCTHLGCAYRWEQKGRLFTCPCHGSTFSMDGRVLSGPATRPLDRYDVRLEGNRLWVGTIRKEDGEQS